MRILTQRSVLASVMAVAVLGLLGGGCGGDDDSGSQSDGASKAKTGKVALLFPGTNAIRYEESDKPYFVAKMKKLCPDCEIIYNNTQDPAQQQQQAEAALTAGANVLVLAAVDTASAATIVAQAKARKVPVVSYDRLITDTPDVAAYISFDNVKVGKLQGKALLDKLKDDGQVDSGEIVMLNGAPTDNNAKLFKEGAHSILDGQVKIGREYDTPDWLPTNGQREMDQAITALGKSSITGVLAANDGLAGAAIAAMKSGGIDPTKVPVTGQDAEVQGLQRIVEGSQYMTVYKAIKPEAEAGAELAYDLLQGKKVKTSRTVDNGAAKVPSILLEPVAVTVDNLMDTVIADGFASAKEICSGKFKSDCAKAGIH